MLLKKKKVLEYISDDREMSFDDSDRGEYNEENSDKENYNEENYV